jgi:hypothetical protein
MAFVNPNTQLVPFVSLSWFYHDVHRDKPTTSGTSTAHTFDYTTNWLHFPSLKWDAEQRRPKELLRDTVARLGGRVVGIIAIPMIILHDIPDFRVGSTAERAKMATKIMVWNQALAWSTVPKLSVVIRKKYRRGIQQHVRAWNGRRLCGSLAERRDQFYRSGGWHQCGVRSAAG